MLDMLLKMPMETLRMVPDLRNIGASHKAWHHEEQDGSPSACRHSPDDRGEWHWHSIHDGITSKWAVWTMCLAGRGVGGGEGGGGSVGLGDDALCNLTPPLWPLLRPMAPLTQQTKGQGWRLQAQVMMLRAPLAHPSLQGLSLYNS